MAEAFDAALRRRLETIGSMGGTANKYAQIMYDRRMRQPGEASGGPLMRQPGGPGGAGYAGGGGQGYSGPRGNLQALLNFGRYLEGQGYRVGENPHFGNGRVGGHSRGSRHYSGRAIDVNFGPGGQSRQEMQALDRIVGMARLYGLRSIWRKPGHFNHAHFDF